MLTLAIATAAALGVIVVVALLVILVFLLEINRFMAGTSAALERVDEGAARFAGRIERIGCSTHAAANELTVPET